ncbi:unnamed protein product [Gadus morhua 'NCC']
MVKPQSQHSGGRGVEQAGCSYAGDGEASWTAPAPGVISSLAGQQNRAPCCDPDCLLPPGPLGADPDWHVEYPDSFCVVEGSTATIPCSFTHPTVHKETRVVVERVEEGTNADCVTVRLQVCLETLGVEEETLEGVPAHLRLPVAVTRYWLRRASPEPTLLKALLMVMVQGELKRRTGGTTGSFNQWQACLKDASQLNLLLCKPLPEPHYAWLVHQRQKQLLNWEPEEMGWSGATVRPARSQDYLRGKAKNRFEIGTGFDRWKRVSSCFFRNICP